MDPLRVEVSATVVPEDTAGKRTLFRWKQHMLLQNANKRMQNAKRIANEYPVLTLNKRLTLRQLISVSPTRVTPLASASGPS